MDRIMGLAGQLLCSDLPESLPRRVGGIADSASFRGNN